MRTNLNLLKRDLKTLPARRAAALELLESGDLNATAVNNLIREQFGVGMNFEWLLKNQDRLRKQRARKARVPKAPAPRRSPVVTPVVEALTALALEIINLRAMVRLQDQSIAQLEAERDAAAAEERATCIGIIHNEIILNGRQASLSVALSAIRARGDK